MTARYSIQEIDEMRMLVWKKLARELGVDLLGIAESSVEDRLRTYMLGGVRPEELMIKNQNINHGTRR